MATKAYPPLLWMGREWDAKVPSAVLSGIVGDAAHGRSGYHISRQDAYRNDYSVVQFLLDKYGPSDAASAVDMTMDTDRMKLITRRLVAAAKNKDPRILKYVRAFNGTTTGTRAIRVEVLEYANSGGSRGVYSATQDHLWHCVPTSTKILTRRGWLSWDEVKIGVDETVGMNMQTGQTEWAVIRDIVHNESQELFEFSSYGSMKIQSSSEHRWITHKAKDREAGLSFNTTMDLKGRYKNVLLADPWPESDSPIELSLEECELLGWFITDGSAWSGDVIDERWKNEYAYPQKSMFFWQTKPSGRLRLEELFNSAGWEYGTCGTKGFRVYNKAADDFANRLGISFELIKKSPELLIEVISSKMTHEQRVAFFDGVVGGDGNINNGNIQIYQSDNPMMLVIETLISSIGLLYNKYKRKMENHPIAIKQPYTISIRKTGRIDAARINPKSIGYQETWCPITDLDTWTAKYEDGPTVLTGNCHLELYRAYANDITAARAVLSVILGQGSSPTASVYNDWSVYPPLALGSRGEAVKVLQRSLNWRRALKGTAQIPVDGVFGDKTQAHVIAYQRALGLPQTGKLDKRMWERLNVWGVGRNSVNDWSSHPTLWLGSQGEAVKVLQRALNSRRNLTDAAMSVDGIFDLEVQAHVIAYQRALGLPVTGVVDNRMWERLNVLGIGREPENDWTVHPPLSRGSYGEAVKVLQRALNYRRNLPDSAKMGIDGVFGLQVEAHVKAYQRALGMEDNGVVSEEMWEALDIPNVGR